MFGDRMIISWHFDDDNDKGLIDFTDITFAFDTADTTTSRSISIKAIQYICGDDNGGPPGCLQYFQENTGTVAR